MFIAKYLMVLQALWPFASGSAKAALNQAQLPSLKLDWGTYKAQVFKNDSNVPYLRH